MDQQTQIILGVIGVIALLMIIGTVWFFRNQADRLAHRKFMRGQATAAVVPQSGYGYGMGMNGTNGSCPCPPATGPHCVPAMVPGRDDIPVAIYGVSRDGCCSGSNGMTQEQLQTLVNAINAQRERENTNKLFEMLGQLSTQYGANAAGGNGGVGPSSKGKSNA